jgi:hypothetical protein
MARPPSYLIPVNFSLTERAKDWIRETVKQCGAENNIDPVPVIVWLADLVDADGSWRELGVPGLGIDDRSRLPSDAIQNCDGMELVFNVPTDRVPAFEGRLLHYSEEKGLHFAVSDDGPPLLRPL